MARSHGHGFRKGWSQNLLGAVSPTFPSSAKQVTSDDQNGDGPIGLRIIPIG
jgi:hypothetical protein